MDGEPARFPLRDPRAWPVPSGPDLSLAVESMSGDLGRGLPPKPVDILIMAAVLLHREPPDTNEREVER